MNLQPLLRPRSVAVVGVSQDPSKLGSRVLRNVLRGGFPRPIFGVGRCGEAQGVACYPEISALPEAPDVAFLAMPAAAVVAAAQACSARGVRAVVVGAAGFAEDGRPEGQAHQDALVQLSRQTGLVVLGPNCNGLYSPHQGLSLGFNTAHSQLIRPGGIALLSHSGALFESMWRRLDSLGAGLSCFVSLGNEAAVDVLDLMEDQIAAAETRVLALLVDALPDGARFAELAARAAAAHKPVVVLKLGRSDVGAAAATAHSSRLVGDAAAYEALFRACGVASTGTLEGFITAAALLDRFGLQAGGLAAISTSGAGGALIADIAARRGVALAAYGQATQARLAPLIRFSSLANPTDLGVFAGVPAYGEIVAPIADDPAVGAVVFQTHTVPGQAEKLFGPLADSQARTGKPHLVLAPGGLPASDVAVAAAAGVILLTDTQAAVEGLGAVLTVKPEAREPGRKPALIDPPGGKMLDEHASLDLLARFGIPVVPTAVCDDLAAAIAAADKLGWPVVLKSAEFGLAHKSDRNLVRVGVADAAALRAAHADMGAPARVLVQPMVAGALEILLGMTWGQGTGLTLVAGLGGIHAEALRQTTKWAVPASRHALRQGLAACALGRVLESPRWRIVGTLEAVVDALASLQDLAAAAPWLEAVDVNPLIATPTGLVAVDALVVRREPA